MGGTGGGLRELVDDNNADAGRALYHDASSNVPMTGGNQTGNDVDRTAIIREFPLDLGTSKAN